MAQVRDEIRNVAIVGHRGSGKTSLAEAMLYVARATPKLGRVDERTSVLDEAPEEQERLATLESSVVQLTWANRHINLIDTPGETSFFADTRLALAAVDAAVVVVSARDGVQPGTERVLRWVRDHGIPCFVALAKCDDERARVDDVIAEVRAKFKLPVAVMEVPLGQAADFRGVVAVRTQKTWIGDETPTSKAVEIPAEAKDALAKARTKLVDDVASTDDALTEKYLAEGDLSQQDLDHGAQEAVAAGKMVPVYLVSGPRAIGVHALLDAICELSPGPGAHRAWPGRESANGSTVERKGSPDEPLALFVFKTHIDPHAGRLSFARVLSGTLKSDTQLGNASNGNREKIGHILHYVGKEGKQATEAVAGDIVALPKLKHVRTGETLSDEKHPFLLNPVETSAPLFSRTVQVDGKAADEKVARQLLIIAEEDPGLVVSHDEVTRDLVMSGSGAVHLEITLDRLRRRTQQNCRLGPPKIAYRETITKKAQNVEGKLKKQSGGHGQFAVCYIDMEPLPRGGDFEFVDNIVGGTIPRQWIPSVEKGILKSRERGVLAGFRMVDFRVRLFDGKYHDVDSSDAAFQIAGSKAFKAAAAAAKPVILEPVMKLQVTVPSEAMGDAIGDLNSRRGKVLGTDAVDDNTVIDAYVPLAELLEYEPKLKSLTQGKGTFTMTLDHMDVCPPPIQEKVIRESGHKAVEEED